MNRKNTVTFSILTLSCIVALETNVTTPITNKKSVKKLPLPVYKTEEFNLEAKLKDFSKEQINEHKTLYKGYVDKRNEITKTLDKADRLEANANYSTFRGLKSAETYVANGDVLHRLYFQNLGGKGTKVGPKTEKIIIENFGSLEAYKQDLFATAKSARGWAITAYTPDDNRVHNFLLDTHNQKVPAFAIPLVVLDVYEHAYMVDFGTEKGSYLDVFSYNINWDVIENRVSFVEAISWSDYFAAPVVVR